MKIETKAVHAGRQPDSTTGAVASPLHLSTTFERQADGSYPTGFEYIRDANPNRNALEACVSGLEGGAAAAAFASGSAATMVIFESLAPGDHLIAPADLYWGVRVMLREHFTGWGLETTFVDMTDTAAVERAVRANTKLILAETPSNPMLKITDIRRVAEIARAAGAAFACDNTVATPVLQQPLLLGADLVVHSATKYLGGHDDTMCGLVVAREDTELFRKIKRLQKTAGAIPSPFTCWLTLRGIQTLPYRVRAHSENAMRVAAFLDQHPRIDTVFYPGLPGHAGHTVAAEQMSRFGGMMSILVKGDREAAMKVAAKVKLFTRATSFGGPHSLIEHRASVEAPGTKTPDNLLRLSVGLEHADDLIADLEQALDGQPQR
jgi:cystathionine gamma-synthase